MILTCRKTFLFIEIKALDAFTNRTANKFGFCTFLHCMCDELTVQHKLPVILLTCYVCLYVCYNINSISNKFDNLKLIMQHKIDIFVITETKTDSTFPLNQFAIQGYSKPCRFHRNRNGGGVFIYVREDIPLGN